MKLKTIIKCLVSKVAEGRGLSIEKVDSIGQGRVWSGSDGKKLGLVDELGGLTTAINIAKVKAGIIDENWELVEYPEPGLFDFNIFMPKIFGIDVSTEDSMIQDIKFRMNFNGKPLMMIPAEYEMPVNNKIDLLSGCFEYKKKPHAFTHAVF